MKVAGTPEVHYASELLFDFTQQARIASRQLQRGESPPAFPAGAEVLLPKYFPAPLRRIPTWSATSLIICTCLLPAAGQSAPAAHCHHA